MSFDSPAAILYDENGKPLAILPAVAVPASTPGTLLLGVDGSNNARTITTSSSGNPIVVGAGVAGTPSGGIVTIQGDVSGTPIPVSGSITVNIGTSGSLALDSTVAKLTIAQGTALGSNTQALIGASVTVAAPTYTTGNINPLSLTTAGALRTDSSGVTQPISGSVSQSGTWTVQPGNTANTTPWLSTISQGGNSATVSAGGALKVDNSAVTQPVSGSVTANIGTSGSLALDATVAKLTIAQSTALGSNTQALIGGSVTTAAPTYTTGNINPLSLTTAGALRTDSSGTTQPISGTVTANAGTGSFTVAQATASNLNANVSGTVTSNIGTTNGLALDATLAKLTVAQSASLGTNTQALIGGSVTTAAPTYTTGNINPLSLTTTGLLRVDNSGVTQPVSGTVSATQSGTWTVQPGNTANTTPWLATINQGGNSATVTASNALKVDGSAVTQPVSGTVTANIGTSGSLALDATLTGGTQTTRITDGTNTATVKAASTAAVATDKALVVAISPNNSVAVTQATASNLNAQVQGAGASGAAVTGNPVLVAGSDGTNARTIKTLTDGSLVNRYKELATFTGMATDIAVANNKSMFSIVNASASTVVTRISAIYVTSVQTTGVTGVIGTFELRRITNHSAGTAITAIEKMDTGDSLSSSITVRTNGTVTSESTNLLWRSLFSTDEWTANAAIDSAASGHFFSTMFPIFKRSDFDNKPIILNANEGLTVKFATNSTVGTFDIMVVFTQE